MDTWLRQLIHWSLALLLHGLWHSLMCTLLLVLLVPRELQVQNLLLEYQLLLLGQELVVLALLFVPLPLALLLSRDSLGRGLARECEGVVSRTRHTLQGRLWSAHGARSMVLGGCSQVDCTALTAPTARSSGRGPQLAAAEGIPCVQVGADIRPESAVARSLHLFQDIARTGPRGLGGGYRCRHGASQLEAHWGA